MKTRQDIIDAALAEKLERSNHHQLILDKQKQIAELEKELAFAKNAVLELREWTPEQWEDLCTIQRPEALWISGEQMERFMELEKRAKPCPFSELF